MRLILAALLVCALFTPRAANAQEPVPSLPAPQTTPAPQPLPPDPIGLFVVDVRGAMSRFKQNPTIAAGIGLADAADLPTRGFGLAVGAHVYPIRRQGFALGVGAEMLLRARASRTKPATVETDPDGPTVVTTMSSFAPQLSLNFGKRDGWSYVSVGMGPSSFSSEIEDDPIADAESRPRALNYGGGARWFARRHLAFSLDLRFYAVPAQDAAVNRPAFPSMTVMVFSAGISTR